MCDSDYATNCRAITKVDGEIEFEHLASRNKIEVAYGTTNPEYRGSRYFKILANLDEFPSDVP